MRSSTRLLIVLGALLTSGCHDRNVESSSERDQRERKVLEQSEASNNLLHNRWCSFINDGGEAHFHGFVRLTFQASDLLTIEQYTEFNGQPFDKSDVDKIGLWKWDGQSLDLRLDSKRDARVKISFATLNGIPIMNLEEPKGSAPSPASLAALMWVCNTSVEDPMPIVIPTAPAPDIPD